MATACSSARWLASGTVAATEEHHPDCNRTDDHDRSGCELTWYEMGESFTAYLTPAVP